MPYHRSAFGPRRGSGISSAFWDDLRRACQQVAEDDARRAAEAAAQRAPQRKEQTERERHPPAKDAA